MRNIVTLQRDVKDLGGAIKIGVKFSAWKFSHLSLLNHVAQRATLRAGRHQKQDCKHHIRAERRAGCAT